MEKCGCARKRAGKFVFSVDLVSFCVVGLTCQFRSSGVLFSRVILRRGIVSVFGNVRPIMLS